MLSSALIACWLTLFERRLTFRNQFPGGRGKTSGRGRILRKCSLYSEIKVISKRLSTGCPLNMLGMMKYLRESGAQATIENS